MNDTKRLPSIAIGLALLACLLAGLAVWRSFAVAPGVTEGGRESTLAKVKRTGKLRAAFVPYPPFVQRDAKTEKVGGYFIDLMDVLAKEGGFEVEYEEATLGTMIAALNTEKVDTVVSAVFRSIPRAKEVSFTEPVLFVGMSAVARKDDLRVQTVDDLDREGLKVAVLAGGVGHEYAKKHLPKAELTVLTGADFARPMLEVTTGRADIALSESIGIARFVKEHPEARDVFADNPYSAFGCALVVRQGDTEWKQFLDVALSRLELDGTIARLDAKYRRESGVSVWLSKRPPWVSGRKAP